jgi:hypothetical protein
MIDFELAAQKAFEIKFPGIIVKGCLFHFGKTLLKNLVAVGLRQEYLEHEPVRSFFKRVFGLALAPIPSIQSECELLEKHWLSELVATALIGSRAHKFWQYFMRIFFGGKTNLILSYVKQFTSSRFISHHHFHSTGEDEEHGVASGRLHWRFKLGPRSGENEPRHICEPLRTQRNRI